MKKTNLFIILPLLITFLLSTGIARGTSLTIDEGLHIASGITILKTGDYRLVEEHPPLIKLWMALPLLPIHDLPDPTTLAAWAEAENPGTESLPLLHMTQQYLYPYTPIERWLIPARIMEALLGVLLVATLTRWGNDVWGLRGAIFAATLAALDPNLLTHGAVAGTDLGATTFILLALLTCHRFLQRQNLQRSLLTGVILGLALTTKLTAALLGPGLLLTGLLRLKWTNPAERRQLWLHAFLVTAVMLITFWCVYGFTSGSVTGLPFRIPAAAHTTPILRLQEHSAGGHQAFLMGENSEHGWWYYFPVAFILKTPLAVILLLGWAGIKTLQRVFRKRKCTSPVKPRWSDRLSTSLLLVSFSICYIIASLLSPLNIGYRHLLPLLPILYLWLAGLPSLRSQWNISRKSPGKHYRHHFILSLFLVWQLIGTLSIFPHTLTFFNEIAGGAANGWRYLADSNTDWGQAYKALARFQQEQDIDQLQLSAFIFYDPALYGVNYSALTPLRGDTPAVFPSRFAPPPGTYALSVTPLDGIPLADPEMYDWFRWRKPDQQIANAIHYYQVKPEETTNHWVAQCITPTIPLDDAAITSGFGSTTLRRINFLCTEAWIIPDGGNTPGSYGLHGTHLKDTLSARLHTAPPIIMDDFIRDHLHRTQITYQQWEYREVPAFALYYSLASAPELPRSEVWAAPAATSPQTLQSTPRHDGPYPLDGPLTFLGTATRNSETGVEVETWWQVRDSAPKRPLSLMAHLLTFDGQMVAGADGLGVPYEYWQINDIIIQRHHFAWPADHSSCSYILRTGAYWLDDGARWAISNAPPGSDALFILLNPSLTE